MSRARLALFLPFLGGGGAERVMLNLASGYADQGLAVDLVLVKAEGAFLAQVPPTVRIVDLRRQRVLTAIPALLRYLRRERPQALLSTLIHANLGALIAKRLAGVPVRLVVREATVLSEDLRASGGLAARFRLARTGKLLLYRWVYSWADGIVTVSRGVADDLNCSLRLPAGRVQVVPNPVVTPELFRQSAEPLAHPWFVPGAPSVILGVGRLAPEKDYPTLIKAFAQVRARYAARLMILGEGEERPVLQALVAELGLAGQVELPGFVLNPFPYLARSAVFVLSSRYEGLPGALIQAMALGTPVVATDCRSGPAEILDGGRYGPLVAIGDVDALAQAILTQLTGVGDRATVSARIRERAGFYSLEHALASYGQVLFVPPRGTPEVRENSR